MIRETRYVVFKLADAKKALTAGDMLDLVCMGTKIEAYRKQRGAKPIKCVVVESDWPEYEPTWAAIAKRVDPAPSGGGVGAGREATEAD